MSAPEQNPWLSVTGGTAGPRYAARFAALAASGQDVDGEARRVLSLLEGPADVLDAGCGTGRVALVLAAAGHRVVGVDLDASMLGEARAAAPHAEWVLGDVSELDLADRFDAAVAAGNLWPLLTPGTHARAVARLAAHLRPGGFLLAGFGLDREHVPFALPGGRPYPDLAAWDDACAAAGLELVARTSDWAGTEEYRGGGYVVSLHRPGRRSDPEAAPPGPGRRPGRSAPGPDPSRRSRTGR
jgi:SAM-dependent methyltransferase